MANYLMAVDYFYWHDHENVVVTPPDVSFKPENYPENYANGPDTTLLLWVATRVEPCGCATTQIHPVAVDRVLAIEGERITCYANGHLFVNVALWIPIDNHAIWGWNSGSDDVNPYDQFAKEFLGRE